jgi:F-type H+-transporting ATPase subunit alpha
MSDNKHFDKLIADGNPVGEIIGLDRFLVRVRGLHPVNPHALIMFEDGSKGYIHHILDDHVVILHMGVGGLSVGMTAVVQHSELVSKVGKEFIGRIVSVFGEPLDGKGPIAAGDTWPVFNKAPMLYEREQLSDQLETGLVVIDEIFPLVRGQRMTILGDSKSGKTALAAQIALNQRTTDVTVIYVLIAKRKSEVDELLVRFQEVHALEKAIVVVATMFESLIVNYLSPYVAAAMGEFLWQKCDMDVLIIYDDLTSHAQAYREIALLSGTSPGRDSYPGDMFYAHSSLLERAGKLHRNHKTMTALPLVLAFGGDLTAYLPTNIMSITDGQWILDMQVFRETMRPAISTGLSVTRVGGVGQSKRQKNLGVATVKAINAFKQALEFSHFGSELSADAQHELQRGKRIFELMNQTPTEVYTLGAQVLMLDIIMNLEEGQVLDMKSMKKQANEIAKKFVKDEDFDAIRKELLTVALMEVKK